MESGRNLESRRGVFPNSRGFNSRGFDSGNWKSGGFGGGFGTYSTIPGGRKGELLNVYRKSVNVKYGCIFPVTRLRRKMKQMTSLRVGEKTAAFLAKMMDVFVHELCRKSGNVIKKQNRKRLTPRSIFLPFDTDVDFERVAKDALLPFSGTHEHIHKVLLKKAKGRFVKNPRKGRRKVLKTARGLKKTPVKKRVNRMIHAPAKMIQPDSSTTISPSITPFTNSSVTPSITPSISPSAPFSITAASKKSANDQKLAAWALAKLQSSAAKDGKYTQAASSKTPAAKRSTSKKKGESLKKKVDPKDKAKAKALKTGRATRLDKPGSDWWSTTPSITPSISPAGGTPPPNRSISVTPSVSPGGTQTITATSRATGMNLFAPAATASTSISPGGTRSINASASAPPINPLSKL